METIIFDCGGGNSVSIDGEFVYESTFHDERHNQFLKKTAEGMAIAYDISGTNIIEGIIVIKNVSYADGELLRTWLYEKAVFQLNSFSVTTPSGVDLGEGKGASLTNVNFNKKNDSGVFRYIEPGIYKIKFPYVCKR